jgi:hypothetical protein
MKELFKTFLFQLACIIIFGYLYWIFRDEFILNYISPKKPNLEILDCFYTSVTIQCGVGYAILNPRTNTAVLLLTIHQLIMIFTNIVMFYLFAIFISL